MCVTVSGLDCESALARHCRRSSGGTVCCSPPPTTAAGAGRPDGPSPSKGGRSTAAVLLPSPITTTRRAPDASPDM
eukprot:CAMPEP_0170160084 /NCGR_PEP_ID=MMETSP0033_2-20121228/72548_1 /TAXON_ID=195969 /ORGANISM="Dolichomastix tenuilepis, Strain CCMP3274" /LENGTH=75 /DNA_ID=CAMNT_0010397615 /DNA_START=20 /DNA_END=247 /DNA_ORIENTATION=-